MIPTPFSRYSYWLLLFFAAATTASIAAQNAIWVAVLLWFFGRFRTGQKIAWPRGLFPLATLIFLVPFFISSCLGIHPSQSFQTVFKYLTYLLMFPIGAMELTFPEIRRLLDFFVGGSFVCAAYGIYKYLAGIECRISSFSGYYLIFGGLLMSALLILIHRMIREPRKARHWVVLAALLAAFLLNETRGTWLGFAAGLVVLLWPRNRRLLAAGAVLALAGYFILPGQLQQRVQSIADWKDQPRLFIWDAGVKIIKDYPVFGIGQGNLGDIYPRYVSPEAVERNQPHLHDNYLQIQVQNGILGTVTYLFWIFAFFRSCRRHGWTGESGRLNLLFMSLFAASLVWGLTQYTFAHQFMYFQAFLLGLQCRLWALGAEGAGSEPIQSPQA